MTKAEFDEKYDSLSNKLTHSIGMDIVSALKEEGKGVDSEELLALLLDASFKFTRSYVKNMLQAFLEVE